MLREISFFVAEAVRNPERRRLAVPVICGGLS